MTTPSSDASQVENREGGEGAGDDQAKQRRWRAPQGHRRKRAKGHSSIDVYEVEPGPGGLRYKGQPIATLPADAPLPLPGDRIVLPRRKAADVREPPLAGCDVLTPYRVVSREHLYVPTSEGKPDSNRPQPTRHLTSWIFVEPLARAER